MIRLAALLAILPTATLAQDQCGPIEGVLSFLAQEYGELAIGGGLTPAGSLMQVLTNPDTGTWTFVRITADGVACLLASGEAWVTLAGERPPQGTLN